MHDSAPSPKRAETRAPNCGPTLDAAAYARNGFAVLPRLMDPDLTKRLVESLEGIAPATDDLPPHLMRRIVFEKDLPSAPRDGVPMEAVGDAIHILGDPPAFDGAFAALARLPGLKSAATDALGSGDLVLHSMNVTIKHPRFGRAIAWHRDFPNSYACPAGPSFVRVLVCLDGMDEESGATAFLPGSHQVSDAAARAPLQPAEVARKRHVLARCEPGDGVIVHPKVVHGGFMNRSDRPRRNVVLQVGLAAHPLVQAPHDESLCGLAL